jgi:transposase-like protein
VVDGLKGFPEAITSVFPQTTVRTCIVIVHLIRNSLAFVSWKDRKAILPAIKAIYRAETAEAALVRLADFEAEWGQERPRLSRAASVTQPSDYMLKRWDDFARLLSDGRVCLTNNAAERALRCSPAPNAAPTAPLSWPR